MSKNYSSHSSGSLIEIVPYPVSPLVPSSTVTVTVDHSDNPTDGYGSCVSDEDSDEDGWDAIFAEADAGNVDQTNKEKIGSSPCKQAGYVRMPKLDVWGHSIEIIAAEQESSDLLKYHDSRVTTGLSEVIPLIRYHLIRTEGQTTVTTSLELVHPSWRDALATYPTLCSTVLDSLTLWPERPQHIQHLEIVIDQEMEHYPLPKLWQYTSLITLKLVLYAHTAPRYHLNLETVVFDICCQKIGDRTKAGDVGYHGSLKNIGLVLTQNTILKIAVDGYNLSFPFYENHLRGHKLVVVIKGDGYSPVSILNAICRKAPFKVVHVHFEGKLKKPLLEDLIGALRRFDDVAYRVLVSEQSLFRDPSTL